MSEFLTDLSADMEDSFTPDDFIADTLGPDVDPRFVGPDTDTPDESFIQPETQTPRAKQYTKKVRKSLNGLMRAAFVKNETVPDAAAIIMHGQEVSKAWGDLADSDIRVRKAIDFIGGGVSNPYLAAISATLPLVLQMVRNHEPVLEPTMRGIPIGRNGKRLNLKLGVKLGILRPGTNDPQRLVETTLTNPRVVEALKKAGIDVVGG